MNADPNDTMWLIFILIMIMCSLAYWIPSVIAFYRDHPNKWWIFVLNFITGATFIGWFVALIWSFGKVGPKLEH